MTNRPSLDEYFLEQVIAIGKRATCDRGRSGCVITRDGRLLTAGYVGSPPGFPHCDDVGHEFDIDNAGVNHCVRTVHAEQNAIADAARRGVALDGGTTYCYMEPCWNCAKLILSVGIVRVVAWKMYRSAQKTRDAFSVAGIQLDVISGLETYE